MGEYWGSRTFPETPLANTRPQRHPIQSIDSTFGRNEASVPICGSISRPQSRYGPQPRLTSHQQQQSAAVQQASDCIEDRPSPEQRNSTFAHANGDRSQGFCSGTSTELQDEFRDIELDRPLCHSNRGSKRRRRPSSSQLESPNTDLAITHRSPPRLHMQCLHCRCGASESFSDRPAQIVSPRAALFSSMPGFAPTRSPNHLEASSDCSITPGGLMQQNMPEPKNEYNPVHSSTEPRRTGRNSWTAASPNGIKNLLEDTLVEGEVRKGKGVEKVVIVYLKEEEAFK
ncbi:MAG: hypothetical protein Q9179_005512 [Wetmoreana sp. 5 TL-2023]